MPASEGIKSSKNLPRPTLILIIASAALLTGVAVFILFPQNRKIAGIEEEKRRAAITLETQKILHPLYTLAKAAATMEFEPQIPLPDRIPLGRDRIATLTEIFTRIAKENRMALAGNTLDFNSLKTRSDSVSMELLFEGDLFDFRECLVSIVSLPFFNAVEAVRITTDKDEVKQFFTKILINIEKK